MSMKQMCPACKGRCTDGNGRACRFCQGVGEVEPTNLNMAHSVVDQRKNNKDQAFLARDRDR